MREPIRVLLVDDHPVFRDGLRQCLEVREDIRVVGAVGSGAEMWSVLADQHPHVVLMDVELPGEGGIELTRALHARHPDVPIVMLTAFSDSERVFAALKAGAVGYLAKNVSPELIRTTVEHVAAGEPVLPADIAGRVLQEFERERAAEQLREPLDRLTPREEEIIKLLATGDSNKDIGRRLFISEQTVKNHLASIFRKLQVNDRTKAALLAVKFGLEPKRDR